MSNHQFAKKTGTSNGNDPAGGTVKVEVTSVKGTINTDLRLEKGSTNTVLVLGCKQGVVMIKQNAFLEVPLFSPASQPI